MVKVEYAILGPVEIRRDGNALPLQAPRQKAVLAALLLHANRVVSIDSLVEQLWGASPPARARNTVHSLVLRLRRTLAPGRSRQGDVLETRPAGYLLRVEPGRLDLDRFVALAARGRTELAAGDPAAAAATLGEALRLWRGEPFADAAGPGLQDIAAPHLRERRLQVIEDRADADLRLARHNELIVELPPLIDTQPLRERLYALLMLALYRAGRQVEALDTFDRLRRTLVDELGVDPDPALQQLHRQILTHDADLDLPGAKGRLDRPLPAARRAFRGLPPDLGDFTGRVLNLSRLRTLLAPGGPGDGVAINGGPGAGKTALAVHLAHQVRDQFTDGQLLIDLRGLDARPLTPAAALDQVLRAVGVDASALPDHLDDRSAMYRSLLADRRVLLVLDNAADETQVRPLLPGSPGCRIIVTSRRPLAALAPGVRATRLEALPLQDAVALLSRIVGPARADQEAAQLARIAQLCGRLPLALRVAGARLVSKPHWALSRMADRLAAPGRLDDLAVGDLRVRDSIRLSVEALREPERHALPALGELWQVDFTVGHAATALGVPEAEAEDLVERLVDAQVLVCAGPGRTGQLRYRFPDLVRDFVRDDVRRAAPAVVTAG